MGDAEKIRAAGWRQGSVLLPADLPEDLALSLASPPLPADAIYLVISQDCDVVQRNFVKEPFVELLPCIPVQGEPDGELHHAKNPRKVQFLVGESFFQACCHDRTRMDRAVLGRLRPSDRHPVDEPTVEMFRTWLSKRYLRAAFPDTLNERMGAEPHRRRIRKLLEKSGHLFQALYLSCEPRDEELPEGETYTVMLWMAMTVEDYANDTLRKEANQACQELEGHLAKLTGLEITECSVRHEGQITLDDLHYFAPWDFDYLTHREEMED